MAAQDRQPLNIDGLIGDTLTVLRKCWLRSLIWICLPLAGIYWFVDGLYERFEYHPYGGPLYAGIFLLSLVASLPLCAFLTLLIDAMRRGARIDAQFYWARSFGTVGPLILIGTYFYLISTLATVLLIVPGLYLGACFSVFLPVLMLENAGWQSAHRAFTLASGYFWPLVRAMLVVVGLQLLIGLLGSVPYFMAVRFSNQPLEFLFYGASGRAFEALLDALLLVTGVAFGVVLHGRLVWLKEGGVADDLVSIFD